MTTEHTTAPGSAGASGTAVESEAHALGALAAELSAAATPDEVAHALVERMPPLLGAVGGALGLVQDDELVIVDPGGVRRATLPARLRIPLDARAPIAQAARTGAPAFANSREEFEREFPDGAKLAEYAASALAVPLRSEERVVGSMGFPFESANSVDADLVALAQLAASLGGQALERSRLYDRERSLREGLDRIARFAPRFAGERTEAVMEAVCREALATFDGDLAQLWALAADEAVLVHQEPPDDDCPPGTRSARSDVPGLEESLTRTAPTFAKGPTEGPTDTDAPFTLVRGGTALQIPIEVAGDIGRMLRVVWSDDVPTDRPETFVLARRLADHVGLALEHAERRRAQEAANRSAHETRRLLAVTEALGAATTPELVGAAALEEAHTTLRAAAGALLRLVGDQFVLIASSGYTGEELAGWERFDRSARAPLAVAVTRNEVIVHRTREELAGDFPELAARTRHGAWLSIPLSVAGRTIGAIGLSFAEGRTFRPAELEYVDSLARQAALALDRTLLLEDEQRARVRAEQLAADLSRLHAFATSLGSATSTSEIGTLLCEQVKSVLGASACAVYEPDGGSHFQLLHGSSSAAGADGSAEDDAPWPSSLDATLDPTGSVWLASDEDWRSAEPYRDLRTPGSVAVAVVPLATGGERIGMLVAWFSTDEFPEESGKRLLETMVRQSTQPLARVRLLESERQARLDAQTAVQRTRTLHVVAERMSVAVTPADVAEVVSSSLQGLLAADVVEVFKLDEGRRRAQLLASTGGASEPLVGLDELELTLAGDDRPPDEAAGRRYTYPLASGRRTPGVVRLSFDAPVVIDDESGSMIQAITRQGGQALDRSLLYEDELLARTRTERLQALTAAFSGSLTLDEVATVFVEDALEGLSVKGVFLGVTGPEERELRALAWRGYPDEAVEHLLYVSSTHRTPVSIAARKGAASYFETATQLGARYPELGVALEKIGHETFAFLPVQAGATPLGVAVFSWRGQAELDDDAWSFLQALTTQCGLALDRAQRYESERSVAETLQRSVLPRSLPVMEGVRVAARYLPGMSALDVGGDWFDTLTLPDGRLGFAVGDVVGKGVSAAATMGQLRNGMRALTLDESDPGRTMTNLNRLLDGITDAPFATVAYLTLDPKTLAATLVSAGHLPPLVIEPSGEARFVEEGRNLPLGVDVDLPLEGASIRLEPGSLVVLYTDGLVERAEESIDDGLGRLAAVTVPADRDPEQLADTILAELLGDERLRDDVALLVLELAPSASRPLELTFPADSSSLRPLRTEVADWLEREHVPAGDAKDILLAVWEAATNAVEHGSRDGGTVTVSASIVGDRVLIEVVDDGRWQEPRRRENRGLGLRVIRSLMTDVELAHSDRGTQVHMERSLSSQAAGNGGRGEGED